MAIINAVNNTVSYSTEELAEVQDAIRSADRIAQDEKSDAVNKLADIRLELRNIRMALCLQK
jgi:NTP pyrophosphatase (non-canonical NTP hydrolase)